MLNWMVQTKTPTSVTWVCQVGYVHEANGRVSWGFWKNTRGGGHKAKDVDAGKAALEEAYSPEYMRLLEDAIVGEYGPCIKCGEEKLGTPQDDGEVLCLTCQNKYRRDLSL